MILERLFEIKLNKVRPLKFFERQPQASCLAFQSAPMIYVLFSDWRYRDKFTDGKGPSGWKYADIIEVSMELIFIEVAVSCMFWFDLGGKVSEGFW
jgi:hypothetical protein